MNHPERQLLPIFQPKMVISWLIWHTPEHSQELELQTIHTYMVQFVHWPKKISVVALSRINLSATRLHLKKCVALSVTHLPQESSVLSVVRHVNNTHVSERSNQPHCFLFWACNIKRPTINSNFSKHSMSLWLDNVTSHTLYYAPETQSIDWVISSNY